jgi:hypothetical protein
MGTDGAAVNTGRSNGLIALLTRDGMPWLKGVWCVAHQLELGLLDCFKHEKLLQDVKELLQGVYKQYKYSPKALRELREIAEALEEKVLVPSNILGTRWTPHMHRALESLLNNNFHALYVYFDNCAEARGASDIMVGRSRNIRNKLRSYKFLLFMHLMLDILTAAKFVSLKFQSNDCTLSSATDSIVTFIMEIQSLHQHAPNLHRFEQSIEKETVDSCDSEDVSEGEDPSEVVGKLKWKDVELTSHASTRRNFEELKMQLLTDTVEYISSRFGIFKDDDVLSALQVLDPSNWPESEYELPPYGVKELETIMDFYQPFIQNMGFSAIHARHEWSELKVFGSRRLPRDSARFWYKVLVDYKDRFPNLSIVAEIMLCLPLNTACCERAFSAMKKIKHDWRASLTPTTLSTLMRISQEGVAIKDFDPEPAMQYWWTSGQRSKRPSYVDN